MVSVHTIHTFQWQKLTINQDWLVDDPGYSVQKSKDLFLETMRDVNPAEEKHIYLQHDTHWQTAWQVLSPH